MNSADKRKKKKGHRKQKADPSTAVRNDTATGNGRYQKSKRSPQMTNLDDFFDCMSTETSLYTTPSKPTLQHPTRGARASGNIEWCSSQGSEAYGAGTRFTAEIALAQYRMGAWESPAAIESSLAPPSMTSSFSFSSSSSLRLSSKGNAKLGSNTTQRATSSQDDVSLASSLLSSETVDPLEPLVVDAEEPHFDDQSTASSDISWNYDNQANYESIDSIMNTTTHHEKATTTSEHHGAINDERKEEEDVYGAVSNRGQNEEASTCSAISALTMYNFSQHRAESKISSWSLVSLSSPSRRGTHNLKSDKVCTMQCTDRGSSTDGKKPKATDVSTSNNDSYCEDDSIPTNSNSGEPLSFSGLISRFEAESLAQRLAPYVPSPQRKMVGRTIDTNALTTISNRASLDVSHAQLNCVKMSVLQTNKDNFTTSKEEDDLTPKISNTSSSLSTCNRMIPDSSTIDPGATSITTGTSTVNKEFSGILSKFETQSLKHRMEPPTPRRMAGQTFRAIANGYTEEEKPECIDDEESQSGHEQNQNAKSSFEEDIQCSHNETTFLSSSSSYSEENSTQQKIVRPDWSPESGGIRETVEATIKIGREGSAEEGLKSNVSLSPQQREVGGIKTEAWDEVSEVEGKSLDPGHFKNVAKQNGEERSTNQVEDQTINCSGDEYNIDKLLLVSSSVNNASSETPPILGSSEVLQSLHAATLKKTTNFDVANKMKNPAHDRLRYNGPVDLDESIDGSSSLPSQEEDEALRMEYENELELSIWDDNEEEDTSNALSQNSLDGDLSFVDEQAASEHYEDTMQSIGVSKRYHASRECDFSGPSLLNEDELTRHIKCMELNGSFPDSTIPGYDDWKREQEAERLHFEELRENVRKQTDKQGEDCSPSKVSQHQVTPSFDTTTASIVDNSKAVTDASLDGTILAMKEREMSPQKKKILVWRLFSGLVHRNGDTSGDKENKRKKGMKVPIQSKKKDDKKVTTSSKSPSSNLDNRFRLVSSNERPVDAHESCDCSLLPLSELTHFINNSGHEGARQQILSEHLESERQKQRQAEIDKDKEEWREQIRISILKEQELERQRRLNTPAISGVTSSIASPGLGFPNQKTSLDYQVTRVNPGSNIGNLPYSSKSSQQGYLYSSIPVNYLCDKSRVTASTARETESLGSCSVNSFLHTSLSFDSAESPSSLNTPKSVSHLPPCAVCKVSERTHISMPCMHYSFCAECAEELHGLETPTCPICQTKDIVLTQVYT